MGFGGNGSGIANATDVALNNPGVDSALTFDSSAQKWRNGPAASRLIENVNVVSASGSAETLPDVTTKSIHDITLSANCTLTFPTATAGKSFTLRVNYPATAYTITWPGAVTWPNSIVPTLTQVNGKYDVFSFVCFSNGTWTGFVAGLNY